MARNRLRYLSDNDWILITGKAKRLTFRLGDEIIREGAHVDAIYVIRRGYASVELTGIGSRTVVTELEPEDICGDMAFLEHSTATAAVIAADDSVEVDAIQAVDLRELFDTFTGLASRFYQSLSRFPARSGCAASRQRLRAALSHSCPRAAPVVSGRIRPARNTSCCDLPDPIQRLTSVERFSCSVLPLRC